PALPHRRRRAPFDAPGLDEDKLDEILRRFEEDNPEPDPEPEPEGPDDGGPDDGGPGDSGPEDDGPGGGGPRDQDHQDGAAGPDSPELPSQRESGADQQDAPQSPSQGQEPRGDHGPEADA
ncbi:hypothetical protein ADK38_42190, partial [Streptomyces varsoviensis]